MGTRKPSLAILASDIRVKRYLTNSVEAVLGDLIDVRGYSLDEGVSGPLWADLVVATGNFLYDEARVMFPKSPIIAAKRVITGYNLEHVIMAPAGARALVVSNPQEASEEIVDSLRAFGINHLQYDCYWRGKKIDAGQYDLVITPNMEHLCPPGLYHVINIGSRALSVTTFGKILEFFGLDMQYLDLFESNYISLHVDTCRKVTRSLEKSERLRRNQTVILHEIDEGILALGENNQVVLANPIINGMFGPTATLPANRELLKILAMFDNEEMKPDETSESERSTELLINHRGKDIYCRKSLIEFGGQRQSFYTFKKVDQIQTLEQSVRRKLFHKGFEAKYHFVDFWGGGEAVETMKKKAAHFAATDQTVLITGESGTGKELLAQSIHNASKRASGPFVGVNFAAISQTLVESELFGYQEGAFTGARKGGKQGFFELAHGGTIFLDEIGDAPMHIQLLLLRVLEEREITRVGGETNIPIDVRVIAATNKSLEQLIAAGQFRNDLFYRLNVLPVRTAPLREMRGELPDFVRRYFAERFGMEKPIHPQIYEVFRHYSWPGNFRELKNVVEYLYYSSVEKKRIEFSDLPDYLLQFAAEQGQGAGRGEWEAQQVAILEREPLLADILSAFPEDASCGVGRNRILERLSARGIHLSESRVKKGIAALGEGGLGRSGATRQGTYITQEGKEMLRYCSYLQQPVRRLPRETR